VFEPSTYALLFPGQGSQFPGMGWGWHRGSSRARGLFERAERLTGIPIRRLCFEGTRAELVRTEVTQPCVLVVGLAGVAVLEERLAARGLPLEPRFLAGHSLGQFTALIAAGALGFEEGLGAVCERAALMAKAGKGGTMGGVLGMDPGRVARLCASAGGRSVTIAAVNGPEHVVVSGEREAIGAVLRTARAAGAERTIELPISVAAHSPAMTGAQVAFAPRVASLGLRRPRVPVVLNGTGKAAVSPREIRAELDGHICAEVRWWPSLRTMVAAGVELLVEVGPGRTFGKALEPAMAPASVVCLERGRVLSDLRVEA
jgi:[acyl-carrier-protein] S-malonyltransferase